MINIIKNSPVVAVLLSLSFWHSFVTAQWVEAEGMASMKNASYADAREAAREDALKQALTEFGVRLSSHQTMRNGELVRDETAFDSEVNIRRQKILEENVDEDDLLTLKLAVDVERIAQCPGSDAAKYRKTLALLGFALQVPDQASVGGLYDIDQGLTSALGTALRGHDNLMVFERGRTGAFVEAGNAPTQLDHNLEVRHALEYAKQLNVQFVVSGVIRDLGLVHPKAYTNSVWRKTMKFFAQANTKRRFSVDLFVHDGFSGEMVWQSNFATEGDWPLEANKRVGFASQEFWKTDFGQQISALLNEAAYSLSEQLRCQPFMTRISRVEGKLLHFGSGANVGIRPGDRLAVYRTYNYFDANHNTGMDLSNTKAVLEVCDVHPGFATGKIPVQPGRINIQQDDLLIAW